MTAGQNPLPFPPVERAGALIHIEGPSSAAARAALAHPELWPGGALALIGPARSGKTQLARTWAERGGGRVIAAADLVGEGSRWLRAAAHAPLAVDDVDRGGAHDAALMTIVDAAKSGELAGVLFVARRAPGEWPILRADLISRLASIPVVEMNEPDEAELAKILAKLFDERGIDADESLIGYLMRRIDRSVAAAEATVVALDRLGLEDQARVTRALARRALARMAQELAGEDERSSADDAVDGIGG